MCLAQVVGGLKAKNKTNWKILHHIKNAGTDVDMVFFYYLSLRAGPALPAGGEAFHVFLPV